MTNAKDAKVDAASKPIMELIEEKLYGADCLDVISVKTEIVNGEEILTHRCRKNEDGLYVDASAYESVLKALRVTCDQLQKNRQFCIWLSVDSHKYPGTDAGNAAKLERFNIEEALQAAAELIGKGE